MNEFDSQRLEIHKDLQSIEAVSDDKRILKQIMIDILNLRNGMEDNLLLIQQIHRMIQKEGEEQRGFNDVINAAQQHIDAIITVYAMGVSWLKNDTDFALSFIQDGNLETHEDDLTDEYGDIRTDLADTVGIDHSYVILPQTLRKIKTPLKKREGSVLLTRRETSTVHSTLRGFSPIDDSAYSNTKHLDSSDLNQDETEIKTENEESNLTVDVDPSTVLNLDVKVEEPYFDHINQQTGMESEPVLFTKNGGRVLVFNGYIFRRNRAVESTNVMYWKCQENKTRKPNSCKANLKTTYFDVMIDKPGPQVIIEGTLHNHSVPEDQMILVELVCNFKKILKQDPSRSLRSIYDELVSGYPSNAPVPPLGKIRLQLRRFKNSQLAAVERDEIHTE
ncbi:uncharacterized protein LOC111695965 [Eurytemora carolleeae]|uniref:uncharacterized protein LOC111695965 n=1 Tax=Eurytemora carolleeae TaxID=1294199 RepID=UPI000C78C4D0|nr:uncharacterized protein LOC111695965 [Eurytemora carolleeae]|eukprot:XP_023321225.1 uncharacterized protein LOC111695965 [Eurytemora affinis]